MPNVKLEADNNRGVILLIVSGDPSQGQPWRIELSADSAYVLGNNMALASLKLASERGSLCNTVAVGSIGNQGGMSGSQEWRFVDRPRQFQQQQQRQRVEQPPRLVPDTFDTGMFGASVNHPSVETQVVDSATAFPAGEGVSTAAVAPEVKEERSST